MQKPSFAETVDAIVAKDSRYDRDAYVFVREGLDYTLKLLKKSAHAAPVHRHVSGQELLEGLRRFALDQFGPMAKTVFEHWGIHRCEDFGEIVFTLVERGVLGKTAQDSREDFRGGYDFEAAFVRPFRPAQPRPQPAAHHRQVAPPEPTREHRQASDSGKLSGGTN